MSIYVCICVYRYICIHMDTCRCIYAYTHTDTERCRVRRSRGVRARSVRRSCSSSSTLNQSTRIHTHTRHPKVCTGEQLVVQSREVLRFRPYAIDALFSHMMLLTDVLHATDEALAVSRRVRQLLCSSTLQPFPPLVYACMYVCMYVRVCVCMYVCMYIDICRYI